MRSDERLAPLTLAIKLERAMIHDQERLRRIRANAQLAFEQLRAASDLQSFGFDEPSVRWLEGYIERQRAREPAPDFIRKLSTVLGCYLGECIIQTYGGHWSDDEQYGLCVAFDERNAAFPLAKVQKQLENGTDAGDGIYGFFTSIPVLFGLQRPSTGDGEQAVNPPIG